MDDANPVYEDLDDDVCYGMAGSPTAALATQLRQMMETAEGDTKCTLCKAAEALEKPASNSWSSSALWMVIIMLMLTPGFCTLENTEMLTACLNAMKSPRDTSEDK